MGCRSSIVDVDEGYLVRGFELIDGELRLLPNLRATREQVKKVVNKLVDLELEHRMALIEVGCLESCAPKTYSLLFDPNTLVISVVGNLAHFCDYLRLKKLCDEVLLRDMEKMLG